MIPYNADPNDSNPIPDLDAFYRVSRAYAICYFDMVNVLGIPKDVADKTTDSVFRINYLPLIRAQQDDLHYNEIITISEVKELFKDKIIRDVVSGEYTIVNKDVTDGMNKILRKMFHYIGTELVKEGSATLGFDEKTNDFVYIPVIKPVDKIKIDFEIVPSEKKKRGRPLGSKNKPRKKKE